MPHIRYSSDEIVRRGEELYRQQLSDQFEAKHRGQFVAIDVETGEYEIDSDKAAALDRMKARRLDAPLYLLRIGFPASVRVGGGI